MLKIITSCTCELSLRLVEDVHSCLPKGKNIRPILVLVEAADQEFVNITSVDVAFAHLLLVLVEQIRHSRWILSLTSTEQQNGVSAFLWKQQHTKERKVPGPRINM